MVLAQLTALVVMGLVLGAVHLGLGRHIQFLDPVKASTGIEYLRIAEFVVIISTVFVKISISLFLKRLLYVSTTAREPSLDLTSLYSSEIMALFANTVWL
jgi:hypothetical protein